MIGVALGFRFDVGADRFFARQRHQLAGFAELLEDLLHARGVLAVVLAQPLLDLGAAGEDDMDVAAESEAQVFDRLGIERIDERDADGVVLLRRWAARDAAGPARPG